MDKLIKQLIKQEPTLNIVLDDAPDVMIIPVILGRCDVTDTKFIGELEYQVSDGMAGKRGISYDEYTWKNAKKSALKLQKELTK